MAGGQVLKWKLSKKIFRSTWLLNLWWLSYQKVQSPARHSPVISVCDISSHNSCAQTFRQMQSGSRRFAVTARLFALTTDRLRYPETAKSVTTAKCSNVLPSHFPSKLRRETLVLRQPARVLSSSPPLILRRATWTWRRRLKKRYKKRTPFNLQITKANRLKNINQI